MDDTAADEKKSSAQGLDGVREETDTMVVRAITVLYGLFGLFLGVKTWMINWWFSADFGYQRLNFGSLLYAAVSRPLLLAIEGFLLAAIAMSLLDSTLRKLSSLGVKRAGWLVPLILLFLTGIIGVLLGIEDWVLWRGGDLTPNTILHMTPGWELPALVLGIVEGTAILGPFMFVGGMLVWWLVVALWSRLRG